MSVTDIPQELQQENILPTEEKKREYHVNNKRSYLICKRIFDVVVSVLAILVLLVPMAVVALLIVIEDPGPVFYSQERLGKNGKPFQILKFRSMCVNAEQNGPQWARTEDPRCTKVGKVIRQWHIDELPQLWNVIKGEMSIVGPRPEREHFYQVFEQDLPNYRDRLLVDQGLTCIGQVNGCYDLTPAKRIDYDIEYIEKQTFWLDLKCIFQTFRVICNHKGAR
jgi:lipopolysaccharide/colanic/teichoic acid biosynthesis glycosyltransferase